MRTKEINMNETINNVEIGDVTLVKMVYMDTTDSDMAKAFAEEYAKKNNLKVFSVYIGLHKWYTGKIGRYATFYKMEG